jgi:uncharacterized membrane protein
MTLSTITQHNEAQKKALAITLKVVQSIAIKQLVILSMVMLGTVMLSVIVLSVVAPQSSVGFLNETLNERTERNKQNKFEFLGLCLKLFYGGI